MLIEPFQEPLPTAWNFRFQPVIGIHTSILISESLVGRSVALTRQYATFPLVAAIVCAEVICEFGSARELRLSHEAAAKVVLVRDTKSNEQANKTDVTIKSCVEVLQERRFSIEGTM